MKSYKRWHHSITQKRGINQKWLLFCEQRLFNPRKFTMGITGDLSLIDHTFTLLFLSLCWAAILSEIHCIAGKEKRMKVYPFFAFDLSWLENPKKYARSHRLQSNFSLTRKSLQGNQRILFSQTERAGKKNWHRLDKYRLEDFSKERDYESRCLCVLEWKSFADTNYFFWLRKKTLLTSSEDLILIAHSLTVFSLSA